MFKVKTSDQTFTYLTFPEARNLYDQQLEFSFAKDVQSLSLHSQNPKEFTLNTVFKTPKSQKVQMLLSQKARNQIQVLRLHHRQNKVLNRQQVRKTSKIYSQINRREDKQTRQNKHTHRLRNKMSKGSNDAIKLHNTFCAFEEADYMDFEEPPSRHHAFNSRSRSPALHP